MDIEKKESWINRAKTAMRRYQCSRPVALALAGGVITKEKTVFDFGCGHGADVRYLRQQKITVSGWDPHHAPKTRLVEADVVNLGYVLNVIEDSRERTETLLKAFGLARELLIVAVRVDESV